MKKLIHVLVALSLILVSPAFADKPTSYSELTNLHGNIEFNAPKMIEGTTLAEYVPMRITLSGTAVTSDGGKLGVEAFRDVGDLSDTRLKGKDLYLALPVWARPLLKELYQEALDVDVGE